jgi:cyanophycin synthetase
MEWLRLLALRGPNIWARFPVLEAWVDLQALKDSASNELPGFNDRLRALLPTLVEHRCSVGERGGFFQRLERGTYLAHILEHVVIELQSLAGTPVSYGKTRMTSTDGVYKIGIEYESEPLARAAAESARLLCLAVVHDTPFDVAAEIVNLRAIADAARPDPLTAALMTAARERRIPITRIELPGLVQLGQGARSRRILYGQTDRSSAVGNSIAYDRELTRTLLQSVGVPVTWARSASSPEDARAAVADVGLPIILRPRYVSGHGGVSPILNTEEEVEAAYRRASDEGWSPMVEHSTGGTEHHLLVIGDRVVAMPEVSVHAAIEARAVDAVAALGLEVAVVEVVAHDLKRPLEEQGGHVVGVIGQPDLKPYLNITPVASVLLDHLFPEPRSSRIPTVSVTGTNGKTTTTRLVAHLLSQAFGPAGLCCTEGIYIGKRRIVKGDCSGPKSARSVLQHPEVRSAALEVARGGILREGLGFDRCDVAVVTNIGEGDHLGSSDINTPEDLAWVKSTIVWAVDPAGSAVLNANDPLVVDMAKYCDGSVMYFARSADNPVIVAHRRAGGRVVIAHDNVILLCEGPQETKLVDLATVPLTGGGRIGFHVENALAATAAAWAVGVPETEIRAGLQSFSASMDHVPARFNLLDVNGRTVLLDYGHNTSALAGLLEVLAQFPHRRRLAVYSAAGDRRDADMIAQGNQLGNAFDVVYLYEDTYLRGRQPGDIFALFRQGLARGSRVTEIHDIRGGPAAIEAALGSSKPGDLLFLQPDLIDDGVYMLKRFVSEGAREITVEEALSRPRRGPDAEQSPSGPDLKLGKNHLGNAVYAARAFHSGERLLQCWGPTTPERSLYTIQVDHDLHLVPPVPLAYLNHSCDPNCGVLIRSGIESIELFTLRTIAPGEEMTLDYETFETEFEALTGPCLCGTASCRKKLVGYAGLPPERRKFYGLYVAEYLRKSDVPAVRRTVVRS